MKFVKALRSKSGFLFSLLLHSYNKSGTKKPCKLGSFQKYQNMNRHNKALSSCSGLDKIVQSTNLLSSPFLSLFLSHVCVNFIGKCSLKIREQQTCI